MQASQIFQTYHYFLWWYLRNNKLPRSAFTNMENHITCITCDMNFHVRVLFTIICGYRHFWSLLQYIITIICMIVYRRITIICNDACLIVFCLLFFLLELVDELWLKNVWKLKFSYQFKIRCLYFVGLFLNFV